MFLIFSGGGGLHEGSLVDTQVPNQDNMETVHFSTLLHVKNLPISETPERPATCPQQQLGIKLALIFVGQKIICAGA